MYLANRGEKPWAVVAHTFALPLGQVYGLWRALREAAIGKYDMDGSRWMSVVLSFFAFGLVGPGCTPVSLCAIILLELQDDPGPPHGTEKKKSFLVINSGFARSVLETRAFLETHLQKLDVKLEAENLHALLADLVRFDFGDGFGSGLILSPWTALTVHHVLGDHLGVKGGSRLVGAWQSFNAKVKAVLGMRRLLKSSRFPPHALLSGFSPSKTVLLLCALRRIHSASSDVALLACLRKV